MTLALITIKEQRFPGGITHCEKCERDRKHHRVTGRTAYACDHCGNHIYPLAGTIFEKSSTSLRLWFYAMYLMGSTRCGISAKQIQRETGVTYKTAWRMFRQIRSLLSEADMQLEGSTIEMDEMLLWRASARGVTRCVRMRWRQVEIAVVGMVERRAQRSRDCAKYVEDASTRDSARTSCRNTCFQRAPCSPMSIRHMTGLGRRPDTSIKRINHSRKVYVMGDVHTQTIEGFWSSGETRNRRRLPLGFSRSICRPILTSTLSGTIAATLGT